MGLKRVPLRGLLLVELVLIDLLVVIISLLIILVHSLILVLVLALFIVLLVAVVVLVVVLVTVLVTASALASFLLDKLPSRGVDDTDGAVGSRNLDFDGSLGRGGGRLGLVGGRENGSNLELAVSESVKNGGLADVGKTEESDRGRLLLALSDLAESSKKLFPSGTSDGGEEVGREGEDGNPSLESLTRNKVWGLAPLDR